MPRNEMKDKIVEAEEGQAECHYCPRIMKKENMNRKTERGIIVYICPHCQP